MVSTWFQQQINTTGKVAFGCYLRNIIFKVCGWGIHTDEEDFVPPLLIDESMACSKTITGSQRQGYYVCDTSIKLPCYKLGIFLPVKLNGGNYREEALCLSHRIKKDKPGKKIIAEHPASASPERWGSWESAEDTSSHSASAPTSTDWAPIGTAHVPVGKPPFRPVRLPIRSIMTPDTTRGPRYIPLDLEMCLIHRLTSR